MRARVGSCIAAYASCAALLLAGCRDRSDKVDASRTESIPERPPHTFDAAAEPFVARKPAPPQPPFDGTAGIVIRDASIARVAMLRDVRAARHDGYDRVVFEFSDELPNYTIEYVDRPVRRCGSGDPTAVAGDAWLEVRFEPADAHDDRGAPTIEHRERQLELGVLRELELTCDFEAHVTWVLGLGSPNRYRVLELDAPLRVVVDVRTAR